MLALLGIAGKIIGMFYRLPLTNILGAEGMGLYQMIFPVYSFILAVLCGGLPAAISKNVSEYTAMKDESAARQTLWSSLVVVTVSGAAIGVVLFLFKDKIAYLQGNDKASVAYISIIPAVVFSGMISCFRGYFQGKQNLLPSGISQIVEQVVKVGAGLFFASVMIERGVEYGVFGALMGVSVSEAAALSYLGIRFFVRAAKKRKSEEISRSIVPVMAEAAADTACVATNGSRAQNESEIPQKARRVKRNFVQTIKDVYSVALPITLGALVLPVSQVVDSFLIVNLLVKSGTDVELSTSLFGLMSGPVGSLLSMPTVITVALATSLLPRIAYNKLKGGDISQAADKSIDVFLFAILPCAAVFAIAPAPVLRILYSRGLTESEIGIAATVLRVESADILALGMIQLTSAMLQGIGKAKIPVSNLVIGAVVKVATTIALLPVLGIVGAAIGNVAFYFVTCISDVVCAKRYYGAFLNLKKRAKIILCALSFSAILALYPLLAMIMNETLAFLCAAGAASCAYVLLSVKTKCILLREMLQ